MGESEAPWEGRPGHTASDDLNWADRVMVALVPVLVICAAAVGTWRYHELAQTSWRGGTLGMFATVDGASNRLVRGVLSDGQIVLAPKSIADDAQRALVTPTDPNLQRLADAWTATEPHVDLERVEVYRTVFDPSRPSIELALIQSHHVGRSG